MRSRSRLCLGYINASSSGFELRVGIDVDNGGARRKDEGVPLMQDANSGNSKFSPVKEYSYFVAEMESTFIP